jgi:hypothetical protein
MRKMLVRNAARNVGRAIELHTCSHSSFAGKASMKVSPSLNVSCNEKKEAEEEEEEEEDCDDEGVLTCLEEKHGI